MFFMMGITDGRKELNYHCFLFHVSSGIGIIMYRQAAVIRYMNLTGKLADG